MADNYLENQYESYLARKAAMGKKPSKKKSIIKVQRLQSEAIEALKEIIEQPDFRMPFDIFREHLYSAESLYQGYQLGKPGSYKDSYDQQVYQHYLSMGKQATDLKETLARTLHDHSMTHAMNDFLAHFDERQVVGVMGGHGLLRTDEAYQQVVMVSKTLAENGCLMVSGGGPGAMEATHLGAWMAGRTEAETDDALAEYLDNATFVNKDGEVCEFTQLQKHDLNLVLQKRYALLNWQQGSGKTAAVYHRAKYLLKYGKVRNVVILAPAIATNMTWTPFLAINKERYRVIRTYKDLEDVPRGIFLLLSTSMVGKLKRDLMRFVKLSSRKLCLVFDESDEITNPSSQRTKHILAVFRRLKYKILDTGTTTRNNIAELYSQFELLYNNSVNMTCWCSSIYHENRDKEIECERNLHCGEPFPAFRGHVLFRACHCPGKATVFGIEKQNQDVYNKDELFDLIGKTIITRKFRDFAGEKYKIRTHTVSPSKGEHEVYRVIIEEFCRICELYYNSTGDTKKDAGLRLMRQIKLLIKACSVPHLISGYYGDAYPSKTRYIESLIRKIPGKVAIGCTTLAAFDLYVSYIRERFPDRPIYVVKGDVAFKKRQSIVTEFDSTINGILICTQQSLSSSVNIPTCNDVILESLQWNIPKMEQFYFRFIRLDSKEMKDVHYVTYEDSVEQNLMALVLTKERLNEFIKTGEVKEQSEIFEEFDITMSVIDSLLIRSTDSEGKIHISWGSQRVTS